MVRVPPSVLFFICYQEGRKPTPHAFFSYDLIFMKLYLSGFVSFELFSGDSLAAVGRWGGGVSIWDPTTFYMGSDDLRFVKWGFLKGTSSGGNLAALTSSAKFMASSAFSFH